MCLFQYILKCKYLILIIICSTIYSNVFSQEVLREKRKLSATKSSVDVHIKLDGELNEDFWHNATKFEHFIQTNLKPGKASDFNTTVYFTYDDYAIYLGVEMLDQKPDNIFAQLSERDGSSNSDLFSFLLDPYQSGTSGFLFTLTPANIQQDARLYDGGEDYSWNAVWTSAAKITSTGWVAEIKIPFAAIRIPDKNIQNWAVNFFREVRKVREISSWNEQNPNIEGELNQCGILEGFQDIKTPVRLSITPYSSYIVQDFKTKDSKSTVNKFNAGLDLKYGINDAFTLDATLVPDFNDVRSDDLFYNLSPYEVQYTDYRPFFTEGLELFNKGNLFYSRRVGSSELNFNALVGSGYKIIEYPSKNRILNASKLTGRTASGLGIGVFNAIEKESIAKVIDISGNELKIKTSPLTNYNVIVLDQNLPNNSSIAFINTNVMRDGSAYDANVTGTDISLRNKANSYFLAGTFAISQLYKNGWNLKSQDVGHSMNFNIGKSSGKYRASFGYAEISPKYNQNDLGFLSAPNFRRAIANFSINQQTPYKNKLKSSHEISFIQTRLMSPNMFTNFEIGLHSFVLTKGWLGYGMDAIITPLGEHNYFDPFVFDFKTYYNRPASINISGFISTDYSKPFAIDFHQSITKFDQAGRFNTSSNAEIRLLINSRFSIFPNLSYSFDQNDEGRIFADTRVVGNDKLANGDVIFGSRNVHSVSPNILSKFILNEALSFTLRLYQFWSLINYHSFGKLNADGELTQTPYTGYDKDNNAIHDQSVSFISIDANFVWRFTPGSTLSLFYIQNSNAFNYGSDTEMNYIKGISGNAYNNRNINTGIKILYFLDYWSTKKYVGEKVHHK